MRKHIVGSLLGISLIITVNLIFGSFVNYAEPRPSPVDMQNIYIERIVAFGGWILGLQLMALILVITERKVRHAVPENSRSRSY